MSKLRLTPPVDPAAAFAREALRRRLVTREQAEECVSARRALARQGKRVAIEDLFLRKGYLAKTDARALARALKPAEAELDLVEEEAARACPACRRDPGVGEDCRHCGADLATGGPGPDATVCGSCGQVMRVGVALCPRCAASVARAGGGRGYEAGPLVGRLALLMAALGVAYFLVWRPLHAAPPAPPDEAAPAIPRAADLAEQGELADAVRLLEEASAGEQAHAARRALAFAARAAGQPDRSRAAARAALERAEEPALRVLLAELALDARRGDEARGELERVPAARRDDAWQRAEARRRLLAGEDAVEPLAAVQARTPADTLALARALGERALARARAGDATRAAQDVDAARATLDAPAVRLRCGLALAALGRHRDALRDLEAGLRAAPADASLVLARALSLEAAGDAAAARDAYREFVRVAGDDPAHAERVARARAKLGE